MSGYLGVGAEAGTFVPGDKAYTYALERCLSGTPEDQKEFGEMLVDWFYSNSDWIEEDGYGTSGEHLW